MFSNTALHAPKYVWFLSKNYEILVKSRSFYLKQQQHKNSFLNETIPISIHSG